MPDGADIDTQQCILEVAPLVAKSPIERLRMDKIRLGPSMMVQALRVIWPSIRTKRIQSVRERSGKAPVL